MGWYLKKPTIDPLMVIRSYFTKPRGILIYWKKNVPFNYYEYKEIIMDHTFFKSSFHSAFFHFPFPISSTLPFPLIVILFRTYVQNLRNFSYFRVINIIGRQQWNLGKDKFFGAKLVYNWLCTSVCRSVLILSPLM